MASSRKHLARLSSIQSAPRVLPQMKGSSATISALVLGGYVFWLGFWVPRALSCMRSGSGTPLLARPPVSIFLPYPVWCGWVSSSFYMTYCLCTPWFFTSSSLLSSGSLVSNPPSHTVSIPVATSGWLFYKTDLGGGGPLTRFLINGVYCPLNFVFYPGIEIVASSGFQGLVGCDIMNQFYLETAGGLSYPYWADA